MRYVYGDQSKPFFATKVLREIQSNSDKKHYTIDLTAAGSKIFTFKESALGLSTIIYPDDFDFETMDFKEPPSDHLGLMLFRNALFGGPIGLTVDLWHKSYMDDLHNETTQYLMGQKIKTKIIDFNLVANENIALADRIVACKVYQANTITCQMAPGTERLPAFTFLINESRKIWISNEVPFGVVKTEGIQTLHMRIDKNNRFGIEIPSSAQRMANASEVVEFSY